MTHPRRMALVRSVREAMGGAPREESTPSATFPIPRQRPVPEQEVIAENNGIITRQVATGNFTRVLCPVACPECGEPYTVQGRQALTPDRHLAWRTCTSCAQR